MEADRAKEEVLQRTDILDLISEYVTLKKAGRNYKGLCPFHNEKTPSFHVNKDKQMFYCFGCHAGGDAFSFLMKKEGLTFPEALEHLARRCGIALLKVNGQKSQQSEKQQIIEINCAAETYFKKNLWKEGIGLSYLKKRDLGDDLIKEFHLG